MDEEAIPQTNRASGDPTNDTARDGLERQLSELTLPLMWSLRQAAVRAFDPLDIRPIRVLLLELIARGMTYPKDLAEVLDTVPPAVSNMLSDLEAKGYLTRHPDPDDGRRIRLSLTKQGTDLLAEVQRRWLDVTHEKLGVLSSDELRVLIATYRKLLGQGTAS